MTIEFTPAGFDAFQNNISNVQTVGIGTDDLVGQLHVSSGPVIIGAATSTGTESQRLQVTGGAYVSGNLGIGITNPGSGLQVAGPSAGIRLTENTASIGDLSSVGWLLYQRSYTDPESSNGFSIRKDSNSSALTIDSSNNIGIGTGDPVGQLHVSSGPVIIGAATSTGTASQRLQVTGGAYVSGNLGIGTTNPTSKLHVVGDVRVTGITTLGLGTTSTPPSNSQMSFELTSNTNLRIKVRGSDGVLRSGNVTLS